MLKSYLKIAFRNLHRQKLFSLTNLFGLAIGLACTLLILLWVRDELGFDRFHQNHEHLFRIIVEWREDAAFGARTPGLLAAAMQEQLPEVTHAVRLHMRPRLVIRHGEKTFYEDGVLRSDPALFDMFDFPFIEGSPGVIEEGMVLTEKVARKYFGDQPAVGQVLNVNNWFDIPVTGVMKELPRHSSIQFDFITELESLKRFWPGGFSWGNFAHETYVNLRAGANAEIVATKATELFLRHNPDIAPYLQRLHLQPLSEVYLTAGISGSQFRSGDQTYVYIFTFVAFFVLVIACINFMNLSTASSLHRAKEVGLRKVAGSNRWLLITQFLGESLFLTFLAALLAMTMVEITLPYFNDLTGKQLALDLLDSDLLAGLAAIVLMAGIMAGSYPAFYLSSFQPLGVVRGGSMRDAGGSGKAGMLRKALVVLQFSLSITLLIGTTVINRQLHYITHKKLGFEKDNVVFVAAKGNFGSQYQAVKQALLAQPGIAAVSAKGSIPTNTVNTTLVDWATKPPGRNFPVELNAVDDNYIEFMKMNVIQGRSFSRDFASDAGSAFIVNEAAVAMMGLESPVGEVIRVGGQRGIIIGVVGNAHFKSLRERIEPQVYHVLADMESEMIDLFGIVMVKIEGGNIAVALDNLEAVWMDMNSNYPFEYHFLDQTYDNLYNQEKRTHAIFNVFTSLAIVVSCLGLFGLTTLVAQSRTKEIGIRKVLGASVANVTTLLSKDFVKLVLIANLFAWPVAWYAMNRWLQNFAYRIEIGWWVFALAGGLALLIALLTVSAQAIRAAVANPVEALRSE